MIKIELWRVDNEIAYETSIQDTRIGPVYGNFDPERIQKYFDFYYDFATRKKVENFKSFAAKTKKLLASQ